MEKKMGGRIKSFLWDKKRRKWRERKRKKRTKRWREIEEMRGRNCHFQN